MHADRNLFVPFYDTPGHIIRRAHQLAAVVFEQEMADANITQTQFAVLRIVAAAPGLEQLEIAAAVYLDAATTGGVLRRLEKLGLISRAPSGRSGRGRAVLLTPAGEKLLCDSAEAFQRAKVRLLSSLNEEQQQTMLTLLSTMCGIDNSLSRKAR